jgi:hypothetical protein
MKNPITIPQTRQAGCREKENDKEVALIGLVLTEEPATHPVGPGLRTEEEKQPGNDERKKDKEDDRDKGQNPMRPELRSKLAH